MASTRKGGRPKGAQRHQNSVAFKAGLHGETRQLKLASALPLAGICARCKEKIEWKKQYGKYKPLSAPRKCVECQEKKVKQAYYRFCEDCAVTKRVCAKCGAQEEIVMNFPPSQSERDREEAEFRCRLKMMTERERRKFLREQMRPNSDEKTNCSSSDEDNDSGSEAEDPSHMTNTRAHVSTAESSEQRTDTGQ